MYLCQASLCFARLRLCFSSRVRLSFLGLHLSEQKTGLEVSLPQVLHDFTIDHLDSGLECRRRPVLLCEAAQDLEQNFF
jgi:hypothetical protein